VTIDKSIPQGAGLGGGSSDAAATLIALERLFDLDLSPKLRYDMAVAVGSDVPFFLYTAPQLAMGRGQVLKEVALPALQLVIAVPDGALSTRTVYGWRDDDATVELKEWAPLARGLSNSIQAAKTVDDVVALIHNDLESSVVARRPAVAELLARVRAQGALAAAMTGSGSAVFGVFADEAAASKARAALAPARAWYVTELQPAPPPPPPSAHRRPKTG
jgi:4-diphosphocytidyl-2-C-methyl-D-erythritol kinase